MTSSTTHLTATGLTKGFNGRQQHVLAVDNLAVELTSNRIVALVGEDGSGRTTALRCLTGTYRPDHGAVVVHGPDGGIDIAQTDSRTIAWTRLHRYSIFDGRIAAPPRQTAARAIARTAGCKESESRAALRRLDAEALADVAVGRLHRAEAIIVALVAALVKPAPILMLDEPHAIGRNNRLDEWIAERAHTGSAVLVTGSPRSRVADLADSCIHLDTVTPTSKEQLSA